MTDQQPTNDSAQPPAANGTREASEALLTQTLGAGNGNPAETRPPANAIWHGECGRWWTGNERSHCSGCHETYSSLSAFDAHRKGGQCHAPAAVGLIARRKPFGDLWGWPAPEGGHRFHDTGEARP